MFRKTALTLLALAAGGTPALTAAYSVTVVKSLPVTSQVLPEMAAIQAVLGEILVMQTATGTAINQNAEKLTAVISRDGQATRQQMIFNSETQRLEEARQSFSVPDSICSESASGVITQGKSTARTRASQYGSGGGVSNNTIADRIKAPANSITREAYDGAKVHAAYCTAAEYSRFGGTGLCPSVGALPGADSRARTLYDGAGDDATPPALTWDQKQIDAAVAYMKNTARPTAGRVPGKREAQTLAGQTYIGLQTEFNGIIDAAAEPQLALIADSTPNEATRTALSETLQSASAKTYFDQVASPEAKRLGYMSQRDFEAFEAGRRYANTAWLTDLHEMQGDNLVRELIRTTAQVNWQLNDLKEQLRKGQVIAGQQLALSARQYYEQPLKTLEASFNQEASK